MLNLLLLMFACLAAGTMLAGIHARKGRRSVLFLAWICAGGAHGGFIATALVSWRMPHDAEYFLGPFLGMTLPLAVACGAIVGGTLPLLIGLVRGPASRTRRHLCAACGYRLFTTQERCPECGRVRVPDTHPPHPRA